MSLKIEFRYSVLCNLIVLLWLTVEFAVGLQDTYIAIEPYLSLLAVSILIPAICYRMALKEKIEALGAITFGRALLTGFALTLITAMLAIPTQLAFHKLINPGFFEAMIQYTATHRQVSMEAAAVYFNLKSYIIQSTLINLGFGVIISFILAWRMPLRPRSE